MSTKPNIAVIGAGIGGLALAGLLGRQGARVTVYGRASQFQRIGDEPQCHAGLAGAGPRSAAAPRGLCAAGVGGTRLE